tara:strand:- start:1988 stop:2317 length:330 start_codon:yes stop_codon:yes gene_type:complete
MSKDQGEAKRVHFYANKDMHIRFKAALEKHQMTMSGFFRSCCQAIVEENPLMSDFMTQLKDSSDQHSKRNNKIAKRDREKGEAIMSDFGFDDQDIQELFDIIADHNPEI